MTRRRRVRLTRNPHGSEQLPYGEWIPVQAVKFNEDGSTQVMTADRAPNRGRRNLGRRRNIAAGFYDEEGIFHPIRASYDYSPGRVGERARKKKKAKTKKRKKR